MHDDESTPSSLEPTATSARPERTRRPRPVLAIVLLVLAGLAALGAAAFVGMGFFRDTSLDVPLPHGVRVGFYENDWPKRWVCRDGHDHWSAPYWSGALGLAVAAAMASVRGIGLRRRR